MKSRGGFRQRYRFLSPVVLTLILLVSACTPLLPKGSVKGARTYRVSTDIVTQDFRRSYTVHVPPGYDGQRRLPMVVVVHGAFDSARGMEKFSGFSRLADEENFLVLYPNGIGILGFLQHWNAGHCCGKAQADGIDDVGFVARIIEAAGKRLNADTDRIFMVGFSNGGMFVHRFAAEKSEMLAGAAALAASIGSRMEGDNHHWRIPRPEKPVPMLVMHGTADTDIPMDGKVSQRRGTTRFYTPVEETLGFWTRRNGCSPTTSIQDFRGGAVRLTQWKDCLSDKSVLYYIIRGWDHRWPGLYYTEDLDEKDPLKKFDAAELIWRFFSSLRR